MTQADFLTALVHVLQLQDITFSRAALLVFVESCWPLIEDDPSTERWSREVVKAPGVTLPPVPRPADTHGYTNRLSDQFALLKTSTSD